MSRLVVRCFSLSLDGFGAGPHQALREPMGVGGMALHQWFIPTRTFQAMFGNPGGEVGIDEDFAARGIDNIGAWIIGRHMFGPMRGPWVDDGWRGWWGENPPYHTDVFVLTHHPRQTLHMEGGTSFHFETEGIEAALERARASAAGRDVRVGGGVETVRQFLRAGLVDEMHLAVSPVLLGAGEHLLHGIDLRRAGLMCAEYRSSEKASHYVLKRI